MAKIKGFDIVPLSHGVPMPGAKVTLKGGRVNVTANAGSKSGIAYFPNKDISGATLDILVNDKVVKSGVKFPAEHEKVIPTLEVEISLETADHKKDDHGAAHDDHGAAHDDHGAAHDDHHAPKGTVVFVLDDESGQYVSGAVIRPKGFPNEVYPIAMDKTSVVIPFFPGDVKLEVSAPGYKDGDSILHKDAKELYIRLKPKKAAPVSANRVMILAILLAAIAFIGWLAWRGMSALPSGAATGGQGVLGTSAADPVLLGIMRYSTLVAMVIVIIGRARLGQWWDIGTAGLFIFAGAVSGALNALNQLDPTVLASLPNEAAKVIVFLQNTRWVVFWAALIIMYFAAWLNTPDMSMPGAVFDLFSLIMFETGFRMGMPIPGSWDQSTAALVLKIFASLHYLLDMFQVPQMVTGKKVETRIWPFVFGILTLVFFGIAALAIDPGMAFLFVGMAMGLFAELTEEITRNYDPDRAPLAVGKMLEFIKTNKADGVLFAGSLVVFISWIIPWWKIF